MNAFKTGILSMMITLIIVALLYYSYIAIDNTQMVISGTPLSIVSTISTDKSFTFDVFGSEYTLNLSFADTAFDTIKKHRYLIPRPIIAAFQAKEWTSIGIEHIQLFIKRGTHSYKKVLV